MRHRRLLAALLGAALLLAACSNAPAAEGPRKKPANVSNGPEQLAPAPNGVVEDTPRWTELPKPIADPFGAGLVRGKLQAFAAMKQTTVQVELKAPADEVAVFKALDAAAAFLPPEYSVLVNIYAPGADGKPRYRGYEWAPLSGNMSRKSSADASQGWNDAITAVTEGTATGVTPEAVKKVAAGQTPPPLFK
jgi:hypothetical protein